MDFLGSAVVSTVELSCDVALEGLFEIGHCKFVEEPRCLAE